MKEFLLFMWQFPQNILGIIVALFSHAELDFDGVWYTQANFGVSLGEFIVLYYKSSNTAVKHEKGHQKQSLYLGWLYLIFIGIPSVCGNLYDRLFHKSWKPLDRIHWYYSLPWEAWADRLGGVVRS